MIYLLRRDGGARGRDPLFWDREEALIGTVVAAVFLLLEPALMISAVDRLGGEVPSETRATTDGMDTEDVMLVITGNRNRHGADHPEACASPRPIRAASAKAWY
jgi:hypothetical protein